MKTKELNKFIVVITILSFIFLLINLGLSKSIFIKSLGYYLYYFVLLFFIINLIQNFIDSKYNLKNNFLDIFFLIVLIIIFIFDKFLRTFLNYDIKVVIIGVIIVRNFLFFYKNIDEQKKISYFSKKLLIHPAKSLVTSYILLISCGTILLMLPISTTVSPKIDFINALFTTTSAVSVTGLTVFDTGSDFTLFGQIIILILIQTGGLGIMIFSYFTGFIVGKKISVEDRVTMSFMVSENDMKNIYKNIRNIVLITFLIEAIGFALLYMKLAFLYDFSLKTFFYAIFHSISAFCNAGFSLYRNNLSDFKSSIFLNLVICFLIITGGISFSVITDLFENLRNFINNKILKKHKAFKKLSLNSIIVLSVTGILIISGMFLIYGFEHHNILLKENILTQYLMSFFQSVTLRTAGFNTIDISALKNYTYLIMIIFMFIGGASGSTAGGIKVNTVGIIYAYFRSILNNENKVVMLKKSISKETITKSFLIVTLSGILIFISSLILSLSEPFSLIQIIFEVTSAFGTVGLSTGITPNLSYLGKIIIIILMFIGKVGPLTILLAASKKVDNASIEYPQAEVNIG